MIHKLDIYLNKNSRKIIQNCTGKKYVPLLRVIDYSASIRRKLCVPGAQFHCFARAIHTNNIINDNSKKKKKESISEMK